MREIDILEMRWCPMSKDKTKRRQQTTFLLAMALAPSFTSQWLAFFEVSSVIHSPFVLPPLAPFHRPYVLSLSVFCDILCLWVLSCISNCSWYSTRGDHGCYRCPGVCLLLAPRIHPSEGPLDSPISCPTNPSLPHVT